MIVLSLSELVILALVNSHGSQATAAYGAVTQIVNYVQFPALSIAITASILGAQAIGAGRIERIGPILRTGLLINLCLTGALVVLGLLVFSKYFYMASLTSYYTFFLIEKFDVSVATSQLYLFLFLGAVAAGTFFGGPIGDRIGRKAVIWFSILGVAPFTLLLPYADLFWTSVLSVIIGFILASAFSAIVVYAQELVPGNVGMIAGIFFGLMFGFGGIGAALLGHLADIHGIEYVYTLCSYLPLFGVLAILLPRTQKT